MWMNIINFINDQFQNAQTMFTSPLGIGEGFFKTYKINYLDRWKITGISTTVQLS